MQDYSCFLPTCDTSTAQSNNPSTPTSTPTPPTHSWFPWGNGTVALLAKDSTPFHSDEPNGDTLPSAKEKIQSKLVQNSRIRLKTAKFDCFGPVLIEFSARNGFPRLLSSLPSVQFHDFPPFQTLQSHNFLRDKPSNPMISSVINPSNPMISSMTNPSNPMISSMQPPASSPFLTLDVTHVYRLYCVPSLP
jgi:hypothetical protein